MFCNGTVLSTVSKYGPRETIVLRTLGIQLLSKSMFLRYVWRDAWCVPVQYICAI